jgi:hypothetical protein
VAYSEVHDERIAIFTYALELAADRA